MLQKKDFSAVPSPTESVKRAGLPKTCTIPVTQEILGDGVSIHFYSWS